MVFHKDKKDGECMKGKLKNWLSAVGIVIGVAILGFMCCGVYGIIIYERWFSGKRISALVLHGGMMVLLAILLRKYKPMEKFYPVNKVHQAWKPYAAPIGEKYTFQHIVVVEFCFLITPFNSFLAEDFGIGNRGVELIYHLGLPGLLEWLFVMVWSLSICGWPLYLALFMTWKIGRQYKAEQEKTRTEQWDRVCSFWRCLITEYGVPSWAWNIMIGQYDVRNITLAEVVADRAYRFDMEKYQVFQAECPVKMVRNEDRIAELERACETVYPNHKNDGQSLNDITPCLAQLANSPHPLHGIVVEAMPGYFRFNSDYFCDSSEKHILPELYYINWNYGIVSMIAAMEKVFAARMASYMTDREIMRIGNMGEKAVQDILDMHSDAFYALCNLRLEDEEGNSYEIDALVLAPNGIYAIEVKNYGVSGRYKIVIESDGKWYKEYTTGKGRSKRDSMDNAFAQNSRHISYLERVINKILRRDMANRVYIDNIVVIANDNVEIEANLVGRQMLIRPGVLYDCLSQSREHLFSMQELQLIRDTLQDKSLPAKKYPLKNYTGELIALRNNWDLIFETYRKIRGSVHKCLDDHPEFWES